MWLRGGGTERRRLSDPDDPDPRQKKMVKRDDLQVVPGIVSSKEVETEIVLLNPIDDVTEARLVASSAGGLVLEGELVRGSGPGRRGVARSPAS